MVQKNEEARAIEYFTRALRLSFGFLKILIAVLIVSYFLSGFYTVKQDEVGVVLRWGRIVGKGEKRIKKPGFHWAFPEPIDKVIKVPVKKVKTIEIKNFWSEDLEKENVTPPPTLIPYLHGYLITGDKNLIHTSWHVEYQIEDPILFLTNITDESKIVEEAVSSAIVKIGSTFNVDDALRTKLESFSYNVEREAQKKLEQLNTGLKLVAVYLDRSVPPLQVADAFDKVVKAEQIKSARINEAKSYANKIINLAKGEAARIISQANSYYSKVVNEALADAEYINKLTQKYKPGSREFETYISYYYQEKMAEILEKLKDKFILNKSLPEKENELRVILGRPPKLTEGE